MEINCLIKNTIVSDLHFIALCFCIWIATLTGFPHPEGQIPTIQLLYIAVAGCVSVAILKFIQHHGTFQGAPQHGDIILQTIVFTIGSMLGELLFYLFVPNAKLFLPQMIILKIIPLAAIIFGSYHIASHLLLKLDRKRKIYLDLTSKERSLFVDEMKEIGMAPYVNYISTEEFNDYVKKGLADKIDLILISHELTKQFEPESSLLQAHLAGVPIIDIGQIICKMTGRVQLAHTDLSAFLLGATQKTLSRRLMLKLRYFLEPIAAFTFAMILLPLIGVIAILLKCTSKGPIFYKQTRTGYLGKSFTLYKFRSMSVDAESNGPQWASPKDSRITPFGSFLRRTRIDEIPQLWNVIRGEMSFIGPRPERPEIYAQLKADVPLFSLRTLVRPGVTGWAQVTAGYAASTEESLLKLEYDLFYIQHMSLQFDLYIIIQTFKTVLFGDQKRRKQNIAEAQTLSFMPKTAVSEISR